jgi:hypothetical protein
MDALVYPMVGPGMAYDRMITGEFIHDRNESDRDDDEPDESSMF